MDAHTAAHRVVVSGDDSCIKGDMLLGLLCNACQDIVLHREKNMGTKLGSLEELYTDFIALSTTGFLKILYCYSGCCRALLGRKRIV